MTKVTCRACGGKGLDPTQVPGGLTRCCPRCGGAGSFSGAEKIREAVDQEMVEELKEEEDEDGSE